MYGASWSGFNSLQVACVRPPALHAIAPIYASDDRYTDDVHYMGGVLKALDLVDWVIYMAACNVLPPVPTVYGEGWREEWLRRIEGTEPWLLRWLEEQNDGPYWRHGSLRPAYDRIVCPTMIVAGWADGYTNIALRAYEAMSCPRRVIIGPWAHMSTATSIPGPHIDLVPELIRWFSRWLRDERNGIDEEPPIAVFMRRSTRPAPDLAEMRGEWRSEPTWPAERLRPQVLRPDGDETDRISVRGDVGTEAWISCAGKPPWTLPDDQRPDDERSLTYDWPPLEDELEVLGHPRLRITVTSPHPVAFLSARLCDVFPDGASALVSRAVINLTHRDGHVAPTPLEPGVPCRSTSSSKRPRGSSRRAIACASRSRARTGRTHGRRRTAARSTSRGHRSSSSSRCSTGPRSRRRPTSGRRGRRIRLPRSQAWGNLPSRA
jgi:predicted acyl esterase